MSTHAGFLISLYVAEVIVMGSSSHLQESGRDVAARVQPSFHSEGFGKWKHPLFRCLIVFCLVFGFTAGRKVCLALPD